MRRTTLVAATLGVTSLAAAAALRFVVVPSQAQLPADTDTTRTYTGTIDVMLNAEALANADLANVIVRDLPVTLERQTTVTVADGAVATVAEDATILTPDGTALLSSATSFEVDRVTMQGLGDRSGLVMGWPIGASAADTTGWSTDLQAEVPLTYVGTQDVDGIEALVFEGVAQGRIVDTETLARFPASLPKFALPLVAGALDLSAEAAVALQQVQPVLPDEVPLAYFLDSTTTYLVDPATGMVLDLDRTESRLVGFDVEGVPSAPLAAVWSIQYSGEAESVAATIADAKAAASQLALFGTTLPLALALAGLALLGLALATGRRGEDDEVVVLDDHKVLVNA